MEEFVDRENRLLQKGNWYKISPNRLNIYRFKNYKDGQAVFDIFFAGGEVSEHTFMEHQISEGANYIDINNFLKSKRNQISSIEKAIALTSSKCTGQFPGEFAEDWECDESGHRVKRKSKPKYWPYPVSFTD